MHPRYATDLNNLGLLYSETGEYSKAESLLREALAVWRATLGPAHLDLTTVLGNLAPILVATDRSTEALELLTEAVTMDDQLVTQVFALGSDQQRMAYLHTLLVNLYSFISLLAVRDAPSCVASPGWAVVLQRKALGAEALAVQRDAILGGRYPNLVPQLAELTAVRRQIAHQMLEGSASDDPVVYQTRLAEELARCDALETLLVRQIPEMRHTQQAREITPETLIAHLPPSTVLVEFIHWTIRDFHAVPARGERIWQAPHYAALVLQPAPTPGWQVIDLGEAAPIDQLIARYRAVLAAPNPHRSVCPAPATGVGLTMEQQLAVGLGLEFDRSVRDSPIGADSLEVETQLAVGLQLRKALFDPLMPALGNYRNLLLAPDGALARLPFEVLPLDTESYLIDEYRISYLTAGRDLLRFATRDRVPNPAVVAANPDFDGGSLTESATLPDGQQLRASLWQSVAAPLHFGPLVGTQEEGIQIASLLNVSPLLGSAVLESTLKAVRSPHILHLATHGFFLPDPQPAIARSAQGRGFITPEKTGRIPQSVPANPLLRSGLALTGANTWLRGGNVRPEVEDGLLTAEDVTGLDLLDTELVVLSACDTGLGEIAVGEGVLGLRRAFVLAGAQTLVLSLWEVPDHPTQELMIDFYTRLLAHQGRADALRGAQLALRAKYPDPRYWGAFICQGNPAPLTLPVAQEYRTPTL